MRRLYRILALRQIGLPLTQIESVIDDEGSALVETLERVECDLERGQRLRQSLIQILDALERSLGPSIDHFIEAMEATTVIPTTVEDVLLRVREDPDAEPRLSDLRRVVLLKESDGERMLPICTGFPEADALAYQLVGWTTPRPLTLESPRASWKRRLLASSVSSSRASASTPSSRR